MSYFLDVKDLKVDFPLRTDFLSPKKVLHAVDNVSFQIKRGNTVGLVGESGSGKSTIGKAIVRLVTITNGCIHLLGKDISSLSEKEFFPYRKKIQIIFQDPYNSLNPRMTIEEILREPLDIHFPGLDKKERKERIASLLTKVGLLPDFMFRYPHEFSGGQRQRIGIARALAVEPEFIICDEAVSALDVSVQAQIVNLLKDLQEELNLTYLFIAHDLAVVKHMSDYVLVMQNGKIVEQGDPETLYKQPSQVYTRTLLDSVPKL